MLAITNGGTGAATSQGAINNLSQLTTNGDLLYHNGTNSTRLARGADGECLTSNAMTILWASCAAGGGITSLNGLTAATQLFADVDDTNVTLAISSVTDTHTFTMGWTGVLALIRGGTNQSSWTAARCVRVNAGGTALESAAADCGTGTVTSVDSTFTGGIISVGGVPITTSGTIAFTLAGTSGGIPYFNSATSWLSSGILSANNPVIGGGAGVAPSVGTRSGNTTTFVTTTGAQTSGDCVEIDASGNHVAAGAACGGAGGGYDTIQDEGSGLTQRTTLNFTGAGVTCSDDAGNTRTNCNIPDNGDITAVTAGDGLSGGGTSGAVTLDVEVTAPIEISADTVACPTCLTGPSSSTAGGIIGGQANGTVGLNPFAQSSTSRTAWDTTLWLTGPALCVSNPGSQTWQVIAYGYNNPTSATISNHGTPTTQNGNATSTCVMQEDAIFLLPKIAILSGEYNWLGANDGTNWSGGVAGSTVQPLATHHGNVVVPAGSTRYTGFGQQVAMNADEEQVQLPVAAALDITRFALSPWERSLRPAR